MIYIASPYTSVNPAVMQQRYEAVRAYNAYLLGQGQYAYSPIVHCHDMALAHELPKDATYWRNFNQHMLGLARSIHILMLPGWEKSIGVRGEILFAQDHDKFIRFENEDYSKY